MTYQTKKPPLLPKSFTISSRTPATRSRLVSATLRQILAQTGDDADEGSLVRVTLRTGIRNLAVRIDDNALPPWRHSIPLGAEDVRAEDIPVLKVPEICDRI